MGTGFSVPKGSRSFMDSIKSKVSSPKDILASRYSLDTISVSFRDLLASSVKSFFNFKIFSSFTVNPAAKSCPPKFIKISFK